MGTSMRDPAGLVVFDVGLQARHPGCEISDMRGMDVVHEVRRTGHVCAAA